MAPCLFRTARRNWSWALCYLNSPLNENFTIQAPAPGSGRPAQSIQQNGLVYTAVFSCWIRNFTESANNRFYRCAQSNRCEYIQKMRPPTIKMYFLVCIKQKQKQEASVSYLGGVVGARDERALGPGLGATRVGVDAGAGDVPHGGELWTPARVSSCTSWCERFLGRKYSRQEVDEVAQTQQSREQHTFTTCVPAPLQELHTQLAHRRATMPDVSATCLALQQSVSCMLSSAPRSKICCHHQHTAWTSSMDAPHPINTLTRTLGNPFHRTMFFDEVKRQHLSKKNTVCVHFAGYHI